MGDNQKSNRFVEGLIHGVTERRALAFSMGVLLVLGMAAGIKHIETNFTHTAFFRPDDPQLLALNAFERQFGNDDMVSVIVHSPSGVFDMDTATLIQEITAKMWRVPHVIRVDSIANFPWVRAAGDDIEIESLFPEEVPLTPEILKEREHVAMNHELLPGYLVSKDRKTAVVFARIRPWFDDKPEVEAVIEKTREVVQSVTRGDHVFHIGGGLAITYAFRESSTQDATRLSPVVLGMVILFLSLTFRRLGGVALPLVVVVSAALCAMGAAGWFHIEITSLTMAVPQILIGIALADSVHILVTFYQGRGSGLSKLEAAKFSFRKNFQPTLLTSASTALGFVSFAGADLPPVSGLGYLAATGTMIAWVLTYLLLGPLMVWCPSRGDRNAKVDDDLQPIMPWVAHYTSWIVEYRWWVIGGFAALSVWATGLTLQNRVNSDPFQYFAKGYWLREPNDFVLANLSGAVGFEVVIDSGKEDGIKSPEFLNKVEILEKKALQLEGVNRAVSIIDSIRQTNRALHGGDNAFYNIPTSSEEIAQVLFLYTMGLPQGMDMNDRMTVKNDAMRLTLLTTVTDSERWMDTAHAIESIAKELGLKAQITGKGTLYQSMNEYVVHSFIKSLLIALVLISLMMVIFFKSWKLGLLSMLPNIFPLIIGGAVLHMMGISLDIGTMLVSSVCLGIAVDDTIHILANFNRMRSQGMSEYEAMSRLLSNTGLALVVTTLVVVAAFGTLAFGTFQPNVYFGMMTAIILSVGLVADLMFLPALLVHKKT